MPNGGGGMYFGEDRSVWEQVRDIQKALARVEKENYDLRDKLKQVEQENDVLREAMKRK